MLHFYSRRRFLVGSLAFGLAIGCSCGYRDDVDYSYNVAQTWPAEGLMHGDIVQFESVFWEPADTVSLRKLIVEDGICSGRDVLEIGTGTGLIAVLCLQYHAKAVVGTDINPAAVGNAKYNIAMLTESTQAYKILDDRKLEDLETDFLPGMLIELTVPAPSAALKH